VVNLTIRPKKIKLLFLVLIGIVFVTLAISILPNSLLPTKIASLVSFNHSPSPVALASPIASPSPLEPSERALKIAAWSVANVNDSLTKEAKKDRGNENMTNAEFIRIFAFELDADSALMAEKEALIQKYQSEQNQAPTYFSETQYSQPAQSNKTNDNLDQLVQEQKQECLQKQAAYNSCLSEYNSKMLEYNNCVQDSFKNKYGYCSKPTNSCFKPLCSCIDPKKHPELYNPTA
jgi:hypothetical protein